MVCSFLCVLKIKWPERFFSITALGRLRQRPGTITKYLPRIMLQVFQKRSTRRFRRTFGFTNRAWMRRGRWRTRLHTF